MATSLSLSAKKLIVHIDASVHQLRSLSPDVAALHASHDGSLFKGVIVTIAGGKTALPQPSSDCLYVCVFSSSIAHSLMQAIRLSLTFPLAISRLGMVGSFLCSVKLAHASAHLTRSRHTRRSRYRVCTHSTCTLLEWSVKQSFIFCPSSEGFCLYFRITTLFCVK